MVAPIDKTGSEALPNKSLFSGPSMAHKGGKGVECSSSAPAFRDLRLKRCRFIGLDINEVLPDDIFIQILVCLPCQSAVTSKLVCKRWLFLISTPAFISCFIKKHYRAHQQEKYLILKANCRCLFLTSQVPKSDIFFSFLPSAEKSSPNCKPKVKFEILASSDDLFLCSPFGNATAYFICNPFTKKWFELPPPPPTSCSPGYVFVYGFTHKPYYHVEEGSDQHRVLVNSSCRFSVVRLSRPPGKAYEFEIDIFSSETWQWTTSMLKHSSSPTRPYSSISRNGLLYWLCYSTGQVIIHDPYNNKVCYVVEQLADTPSQFKFGVSQGSLLAFDIYSSFRVWELEEDEDHQPKWRYVTCSLEDEEYREKSPEMLDWLTPRYTFVVTAVHPNDRNIFFIWTQVGGTGTLNLRTGQFKRRFVPKLVRAVVAVDHLVTRKIKITPTVMAVFKAPCWPTPISALLNQAARL